MYKMALAQHAVCLNVQVLMYFKYSNMYDICTCNADCNAVNQRSQTLAQGAFSALQKSLWDTGLGILNVLTNNNYTEPCTESCFHWGGFPEDHPNRLSACRDSLKELKDSLKECGVEVATVTSAWFSTSQIITHPWGTWEKSQICSIPWSDYWLI